MRKIGQIAETLLDGLREKARREKIIENMKGGTAALAPDRAAARTASVVDPQGKGASGILGHGKITGTET